MIIFNQTEIKNSTISSDQKPTLSRKNIPRPNNLPPKPNVVRQSKEGTLRTNPKAEGTDPSYGILFAP